MPIQEARQLTGAEAGLTLACSQRTFRILRGSSSFARDRKRVRVLIKAIGSLIVYFAPIVIFRHPCAAVASFVQRACPLASHECTL